MNISGRPLVGVNVDICNNSDAEHHEKYLYTFQRMNQPERVPNFQVL
jgi:hypothetical protein